MFMFGCTSTSHPLGPATRVMFSATTSALLSSYTWILCGTVARRGTNSVYLERTAVLCSDSHKSALSPRSTDSYCKTIFRIQICAAAMSATVTGSVQGRAGTIRIAGHAQPRAPLQKAAFFGDRRAFTRVAPATLKAQRLTARTVETRALASGQVCGTGPTHVDWIDIGTSVVANRR